MQDFLGSALSRNLQDLFARTLLKRVHKISTSIQGPLEELTRTAYKETCKELARSLDKDQEHSQDLFTRTCSRNLQDLFARALSKKKKQDLFRRTGSKNLQDLFARTLQENSQDLQTRTLRVHKLSVQGPFEICKIFTRTAQKNSQDLYIYIYTWTLGRNLQDLYTRTRSRNWQNLHARSPSHKNSQDLYFYTSLHKAGGGSFHSEDVFI